MNKISIQSRQAIDILRAGRFIVAAGLIAFGVQHFLYGDFIIGRAPACTSDPAIRLAWAYFSGAVLIVTGFITVAAKKPRSLLILTAAMILFWALLRHIPVLLAINFQWGGELTNGGKALALFGGVCATAATFPKESGSLAKRLPALINQSNAYILLGRYCLAIFLIISGIEHFIFIEFVASLVPSWIPAHNFWAYLAGVALIAGGVGLLIPPTARLAALLIGIMILIWLLVLHIPRAVAAGHDQNEWTAVMEALTFSGIGFVLAGAGSGNK